MAARFKQTLIEARKEAGLTQAQLAEKAGLNSRAYREYETNKNRLPVDVAIRICDALNLSVYDIEFAETGRLKRSLTWLMKFWRKTKNLSQKDVADALGCSLIHVACIEAGRSIPDGVEILNIAEVFDTAADDFIAARERALKERENKNEAAKNNKKAEKAQKDNAKAGH